MSVADEDDQAVRPRADAVGGAASFAVPPARRGDGGEVPATSTAPSPDTGSPGSGSGAASRRIRDPRERLRRNPLLRTLYRAVIGVLGFATIIVGIILLPLPGPGWLIIFAGLGLLSTEFDWAKRVLAFAREQVQAWTHWVGRQPRLVQWSLALCCALIVVVAIVSYEGVIGLPSWTPNFIEDPAAALVP